GCRHCPCGWHSLHGAQDTSTHTALFLNPLPTRPKEYDMATTQGGNPLAKHIDDALKREDHATPATDLPKDEQNPSDGRGGEVDDSLDPQADPARGDTADT